MEFIHSGETSNETCQYASPPIGLEFCNDFEGPIKQVMLCHVTSTVRVFDLIPKLRAKPEYQLSSGSKYINVIQCDSHRHYLDMDTTQSILNNPSGPQSNAIKYKFMTWIWSLFCLQMSSHVCNITYFMTLCPDLPITMVTVHLS